MDEGVYPSQWKWAKIIPVLKSGCRNETTNYRPISILSVVSKVIERYVYDCLYKYLCKYKLLSPHQSGFRKYHSCNTCLCKITNDWLSGINDGNLVGCLALDLSKAFDLINFDILLEKLRLYGCSASMLKWFYSYLHGRTQSVSINNNISSSKEPMTYGVPQGSILGPLLFNIFINDLPLHLKYCSIEMYADDTTLYTVGKNIVDLKHDLNADAQNMTNWFHNNRLMLNVS